MVWPIMARDGLLLAGHVRLRSEASQRTVIFDPCICMGSLHRILSYSWLTVSSFAFLERFALTADTVGFLGVWIWM